MFPWYQSVTPADQRHQMTKKEETWLVICSSFKNVVERVMGRKRVFREHSHLLGIYSSESKETVLSLTDELAEIPTVLSH